MNYISNFYMGEDLGQAQDYTAICIMEHIWARREVVNNIEGIHRLPESEMKFNIIHLERIPLGTSYPSIVTLSGERWHAIPKPDTDSNKVYLVDGTGVGRAVVDMLRAADLPIVPIVITGGNEASEGSWGRHVPKRDLVSALQVLMQSGRLKVANGLAEGPTLVKELQNFKYKVTSSANATYGAWREGTHDDLVLAVALCTWWAHRVSRTGRGA